MTDAYSEQAVLLGQARALMGVLARPIGEARFGRPAVIILNTGIIHRVGHHRMYVTMARQLASAGHTVLRFDFSGIGDSRSRTDNVTPVASCLADIQDALDWLTSSYGATQVVLIGLCSGADIALRFGHGDARVVGLALFDPAIPPTARFYVDYIVRRMSRLRSWLTFASGRGRIWRDIIGRFGFALGARSAAPAVGLVDPRSRSESEALYRDTLERDIRLLVVLTGGDLAGRQTYREQLLDAFPTVPFKDRLQLEFFADCDHTFAPPADRDRLNALTLEWLASTPFRRVSAAPPSAGDEGTGTRSQLRSIL